MKKLLFLLLTIAFAFQCQAQAVGYKFYFQRASHAAVATSGYMAENIVYDSVTAKYWWVFTNTTNGDIGIASATDINGAWTVTTSLIHDASSHVLYAPYLTNFGGSTWYIYYSDTTTKDVRVVSSSSVNSGYGSPTTVLSAGAASSWNENRSSECDVHLIGSTYYMFFMGENVGATNEKVGIATSSTPTGTFVENVSNPIFSGDTEYWNRGTDKAADPEYLYRDGTHYLCMAATRTSGKTANRLVGCYSSTDIDNGPWKPISRNALIQAGSSGGVQADGGFRGGIFDPTGSGNLLYMPYTCQATSAGTYTLCLGKLRLVPEATT